MKVLRMQFVFLLLCGGAAWAEMLTVTVKNPVRMARENQTVEVSWNDLKAKIPELKEDGFSLTDLSCGQPVVVQVVNLDGKRTLVFQSDFVPSQMKRFRLDTKGSPAKAEPKLFAGFMRGREDFAWENDRIAFRVYGPQLQKWAEAGNPAGLISSGVDVWAKRTTEPVIERWYQSGHNYHKDFGEGLDFYGVGKSRGCGGTAIRENGELFVSKNFTDYKVLASGPVRTVFELTYAPWNCGTKKVSETKRITMDVGQNLFRVDSTFSSPVEVLAGITKRKETKVTQKANWISTWENQPKDEAKLGCAIVVPRIAKVTTLEDETHNYVVLNADAGKPMTFYAGAGWTKSGQFKNRATWDKYVASYAATLNAPLEVNEYQPDEIVPVSDAPLSNDQVLETLSKVYEYQVRHPHSGDYQSEKRELGWIPAVLRMGQMKYYDVSADKDALVRLEKFPVGLDLDKQAGHVTPNQVGNVQTPAWLYFKSGEKKVLDTVIPYLEHFVGVDEADQKKAWLPAVNPDRGYFVDSLYMAGPAFAMMYKATGDRRYLDHLNMVYADMKALLYDVDAGFWYRDKVFFDKRSGNGEKLFWARGNGWIYGALAGIISNLSEQEAKPYVEMLKAMAPRFKETQPADGVWRSNLIDYDQAPEKEASGTALICYGLATGINEGILDYETYAPVVFKAWRGLQSLVRDDGYLMNVQSEAAAPGPIHAGLDNEFGVGVFLSAGAKVAKLAGTERPAKVSGCIPPVGRDGFADQAYPLYEEVNRFLARDLTVKQTGVRKEDYLRVINGQVLGMLKYQTPDGAIRNPLTGVDGNYASPHFAHCAAVLMASGYNVDPALRDAAVQAMTYSVEKLAKGISPEYVELREGRITQKQFQAAVARYRANREGLEQLWGAGDFCVLPIMKALPLFKKEMEQGRLDRSLFATWKELVRAINPRTSYNWYLTPTTRRWASNWSIKNGTGDWMREAQGYSTNDYSRIVFMRHENNFTKYGMFREGAYTYDLFPRTALSTILHLGYHGEYAESLRLHTWRGAWTSLFIQSPNGELPPGFRSAAHIWNETMEAELFEIYATEYAAAGRMKEAGAFKRAAHLAFQSVSEWIREDGTGYIVKNRYPNEKTHAYEAYSSHTTYNMLAMSQLASACEMADDSIKETACPAEVGGFAFDLEDEHRNNSTIFPWVVANVEGNYLVINRKADSSGYDATGLLRVFLKGGNPRLGPAASVSPKFAGKGNYIATGPTWETADGERVSLAELKPESRFEVLEQSADKVIFKIEYKVKGGNVTETYCITPEVVDVMDRIAGDLQNIGVQFPLLVTDGAEKTKFKLKKNRLEMELHGLKHYFTVVSPSVELRRENKEYVHINGMAERVFGTSDAAEIRYRLSAKE